MEKLDENRWKGKNVLAIGDSLTSDGRWQKEFARITGCNISTHARGGVGIIDMVFGLGVADSGGMEYDPFTGVNGDFHPLSEDEVRNADLIIFYGAYNERHMEYGEDGDVYPENNTLRGKFEAVLSRIFYLLDEAGNTDCRVMTVTPHCVGKYDWVDADGTEEFPKGSGRSLCTMSSLIADISEKHGIPCCDAYHLSGIGPENWNRYANSPVVMNPEYDPDAEYTAPYPMYADQTHLNAEGYALIGRCIADFALSCDFDI